VPPDRQVEGKIFEQKIVINKWYSGQEK